MKNYRKHETDQIWPLWTYVQPLWTFSQQRNTGKHALCRGSNQRCQVNFSGSKTWPTLLWPHCVASYLCLFEDNHLCLCLWQWQQWQQFVIVLWQKFVFVPWQQWQQFVIVLWQQFMLGLVRWQQYILLRWQQDFSSTFYIHTGVTN